MYTTIEEGVRTRKGPPEEGTIPARKPAANKMASEPLPTDKTTVQFPTSVNERIMSFLASSSLEQPRTPLVRPSKIRYMK